MLYMLKVMNSFMDSNTSNVEVLMLGFFYRTDLAYFDGINETILAAALVKPKIG